MMPNAVIFRKYRNAVHINPIIASIRNGLIAQSSDIKIQLLIFVQKREGVPDEKNIRVDPDGTVHCDWM